MAQSTRAAMESVMLSNADALSRVARSITTSLNCIPGDLVHLINHLSTTAISSDKIKE